MTRPRLPAAAATTLSSLVLFAGCGGAGDKQQVRDTLARFQKATASQDYRTLCTKLLARVVIDRLRSVGLPCEAALQTGLGAVRQPKLKVTRIKIRGSTALAEVRSNAAGQSSSTDTIRLIKEDGDWRLTALSGAQPPTPHRRSGE
jgi:hypothetical protein